jgi:hypothetical protein
VPWVPHGRRLHHLRGTYAGAHRLLDSGLTGPEHVRGISRSSIIGILVTGVMRVPLFLAVLGVGAGGVTLAADNAATSAFQAAAGEIGLRVFGTILWAASITSVIGAAYTPVSFPTTNRASPRRRSLLSVASHRAALRAGGRRPGEAAGVRGRLQRPDPADRVHGRAVGSVAAARPARRPPVSGVAARGGVPARQPTLFLGYRSLDGLATL